MKDYTDEELKVLIYDLINIHGNPKELVRVILMDIIDKKSVLYVLANFGII